MGKLENRSSRIIYHKLIFADRDGAQPIRATHSCSITPNVGGDTMAKSSVICSGFRQRQPMTSSMQLAGFPA